MNKIKHIKIYKRDCSAIRILTVVIFLVIITSPKIYSQAQAQGFTSEGRTNLCTPHTNNIVDSPSTSSWANLSAPNDSASHHAELGALQKNDKTNLTSIKHKSIYPEVDAVVLVRNNSLQSEFIVNPGADIHHIMLTYNRARNIKIEDNYELILDTEFRRYSIHEPIAFQIINGKEVIIDTKYDLDIDGIVSFDINDFDKNLPLMIVPSVVQIDEFAKYNIQYNLKYLDNYMFDFVELQNIK